MLTELLTRAAESNPGRAAVVQGPRRVSYGELAGLSARAAGGLRALGVREGDCVMVALPNSPEFVAAGGAEANLIVATVHAQFPAVRVVWTISPRLGGSIPSSRSDSSGRERSPAAALDSTSGALCTAAFAGLPGINRRTASEARPAAAPSASTCSR